MKVLRIVSLVIHGFVGLGALAGGTGAMLHPLAPMGTSAELLRNSPFETFFIPGLALFGLIGLGNLAAFVMVLRSPRSLGYADGLSGATLLVWIVVQCVMMQLVNSFHVAFFGIGLVQALFATVALFHHRQFPATMVVRFFGAR